jgi:hypothetical protein
MAAPYIHAGLRIGRMAGRRVMSEAMPFCLMSGFEDCVSELFIPDTGVIEMSLVINDYGKVRREFAKAKFPSCQECIHFGKCEGPWKEYPEKRGSFEFIPVKVS